MPLPPDPTLTEAWFGHWFTDTATVLGWNVAHWRTSAIKHHGRWISILEGNTAKGFPDYVLVHSRSGEIIFAELKRDAGVEGGTVHQHVALRPDQIRWRDAILRGPGEYHVWRPADRPEIEARLRVPYE
jgi:hypothetical protein